MWENIYANKNIDFHSYVINIHSFDPKLTYDLQSHFMHIEVFFLLLICNLLFDLDSLGIC
jgi:hypothetical protein